MFSIKDRGGVCVWFLTAKETRHGKDPPTEDGNTHTHPEQDGTRGTVEPRGLRVPQEQNTHPHVFVEFQEGERERWRGR